VRPWAQSTALQKSKTTTTAPQKPDNIKEDYAKKKDFWTEVAVAQVVERLLCKWEVLSKNPSPIKKKERKKENLKEFLMFFFFRIFEYST
jgi:hypothetical protein